VAELTPEEGVEELAEEIVGRVFSAKAVGFGGLFLSLVSGAVGFVVAERKYRRQYEAIAENEISEMRMHFARKELAREDKGSLEEIVKEKGYEVPAANEVVAPPPPEPEQKNVFEEHANTAVDAWSYSEEAKKRTAGVPYVIHYDELGETGYDEATTFTYYAGDDVLCDERDNIVDDRNVLINDDNLDRFGHGSNSPHIVYVRNDDIAAEFELIKSDKSYAEEVAGFKHSDTYPRRRRPKFDDE